MRITNLYPPFPHYEGDTHIIEYSEGKSLLQTIVDARFNKLGLTYIVDTTGEAYKCSDVDKAVRIVVIGGGCNESQSQTVIELRKLCHY